VCTQLIVHLQLRVLLYYFMKRDWDWTIYVIKSHLEIRKGKNSIYESWIRVTMKHRGNGCKVFMFNINAEKASQDCYLW